MIDFEQFRFTADTKLSDLDTNVDGGLEVEELKGLRSEAWAQLAEYQQRLFAESKQSLLIVMQAMDAAGKDSSIGKLTSRLNAQGCHVHSFKKPTELELSHDFLWRVHSKAPAQGEITLFNRSHYEDVLIVKVHGWADEEHIKGRYSQINNFESLLAERGTKVVKFMLNISPEYQLDRFKRRLDVPGKNWKFNPGDLVERQHWDDYMSAFDAAMAKTSTKQAPWYVVPAENRPFRDAMIANVVLQTLQKMNPQYPAPTFDAKKYISSSIS